MYLTAKIIADPTQLSHQMEHPVLKRRTSSAKVTIEQHPFCPKAEVAPVSESRVLKVVPMERRVLKGRTAIITTIIMGKMEIVLPEVSITHEVT